MAVENSLDLEVLNWLAECQRNRFVAVPIPDPVLQRLRGSPARWAQSLSCLDQPLKYEPRSLALSPDGTRIAIGTKAGALHLAEWNGIEWKLDDELTIGPVHDPDNQKALHRAIRGLCFIGTDLLAIGRGAGLFTILDLTSSEADLPVQNIRRSERPAGEDPWLLRFVKIIPLFPGPVVPRNPGANLALGLTLGRTLHLLRRGDPEADSFVVSSVVPEQLFGTTLENNTRIVDGEWWDDRLWLLDSDDTSFPWRASSRHERICNVRCFLFEGAATRKFFQHLSAIVPYFRPRADPRSLSVCKSGVGVRFGEDVSFLPLTALEQKMPPSEDTRWVEIPGATKCVAFQEFDTEDRVYLAVGTSGEGVRWIPWFRDERNKEIWGPRGRGGRRTPSGEAHDAILEMASVRPARDCVYMVLATRGHRMRIASVLNKDIVSAHLVGESFRDEARQFGLVTSRPLGSFISKIIDPEAVRGSETADQHEAFLNQLPRGASLRLVRALIDRQFEAACATGPDFRFANPISEVRWMFEKLELPDLADILRWLRLSWRHAFRHADAEAEDAQRLVPEAETRADIFRQFCLWVFQRAARLNEKSLGDLARVALESIDDLRQELPSGEWRGIGLFGGFLRKWFVYGHTYGEKRQNLHDLYRWNSACDRDLDAIFYLTRVLRRRVDILWARNVEPTEVDAGIWDLATPQGSPFFLHSHTDGRIFATSDRGRPVRWEVEGTRRDTILEKLEAGAIALVEGGLALCHALASEFRHRYRHGPYARSLYIERCAAENGTSTDRFLVLFGIRGWHPTDLDCDACRVENRCHPRLVALDVEWREGEEGPALVILEAAISISLFEPYAIARIPSHDPETFEFVVGTGGASKFPFYQVFAQREAPSTPEKRKAIDLEVHRTPDLAISTYELAIKEDLRWRGIQFFPDDSSTGQKDFTRLDRGPNPCWSAEAFQIPASDGRPAATWLWIGMQDGRVRSFVWDHAGDRWLEGGRWHKDEDGEETRPLRDPILTYSPVRKLRRLTRPGRESLAIPLLAYGTAEGVVGVVPLESPEDEQVLAGAAQAGSLEAKPSEPWVHLVHTRQKSAICGLADYLEGEDWNLAVLTESGRVVIFNLEPGKAASQTGKPQLLHRGLRLDHFLLYTQERELEEVPLRGRALLACLAPGLHSWEVLRQEDEQASSKGLPHLVIGTDGGAVLNHVLAFPKFSVRRSQWGISKVCDLIDRQMEGAAETDDPYLVRSVGANNAHKWLRLAAVGGKNFLRFSLWYELKRKREEGYSADVDRSKSLAANAERFGNVLRALADEVYGRKPFETEAAKILWSETARYANWLAEASVSEPNEENRDQALQAYTRLVREADNLSNRWIGVEQTIEARVLMHSFGDLFDWPSIILLALDEASEGFRTARELLLFKSLQHRLQHNEIIVPLETLRVLNTAILRALVQQYRRMGGRAAPWSLAHRPRKGGPGYYDLATLVGNLVRQQAGRLTPSDPLYTEVSKFFALSILLIPKGILLVGRLVSESRLAEHGTDVGKRILLYAQMFQRQLKQDFEIDLTASGLEQPKDRFEDYLSRKVDLRIGSPGDPSSWRSLLSIPGERDAPPLTDRHYLWEQRKVLLAVARLARLTRSADEEEEQDLRWLGDEETRLYYFGDSRVYLKRLQKKRAELLSMLTNPLRSHDFAQFCEREMNWLDDWPHLSEPRKSHYRFVLEHWRSTLGWQAEEAFKLVDLIDRFNRHMYRTSADDLMASLSEIALRSVPIRFPYPPPKEELPLRLQIRDKLVETPFLSELFRRGSLLVQGSHLAASLLHLSRLVFADRASGGPSVSRSFTLSRIEQKASEIAALEGVEADFHPTPAPVDVLVPGDEIVWSTIIHEIARNVYDYCRTPETRKPKLYLRWERMDSYWWLALGSKLPFCEALDQGTRQELEQAGDKAAFLLRKVKDLLEKPGTRYQTGPSGSGFGLYFLHRLFNLLGEAAADLALLDLQRLRVFCNLENGGLTNPLRSFEDLSHLPLVMVFSWKS